MIKGGHLESDAIDIFFDGKNYIYLEAKRKHIKEIQLLIFYFTLKIFRKILKNVLTSEK